MVKEKVNNKRLGSVINVDIKKEKVGREYLSDEYSLAEKDVLLRLKVAGFHYALQVVAWNRREQIYVY